MFTCDRLAMFFRLAAACLCLTLLPFAVPSAGAQIATATLEGAATDATGAAIPGASLTIKNVQTGVTKAAQTDGEGHYIVLDLAPGIYDIRVEKAGFGTIVQKARELRIGSTATQDFTLKVADVSQVVEVNGVSHVLDITASEVSKTIDPEELDNLPTASRSFSNLAALAPGVLVGNSPSTAVNTSASISIGDGTSYETGYFIDGTDVENNARGGLLLNFVQDWIQEFTLISQTAPAEFGMASSGYVNAVSLSGTNKLHGRVYGYFQNSALNAKPAFSAAGSPKLDASQRRIGADLSGPLVKDKLFYFLGYENWYSNQSVQVSIPAAFTNAAAMIATGVFPQTLATQDAMGKLNYTVNQKNSFWGRWNYEFNRNTNTGIGGPTPVSAGGSLVSGVTAIYAGAYDWTISPKALNEISYNYNRTLPVNGLNCIQYLGTYNGGGALANEAGNPVGYWATIQYPNAPGGTVSGRCGQRLGDQGESETFVNDTYNHTMGRHQFKAGMQAHQWKYLIPAPGLRNQADPTVQVAGTVPFTFDLATSNTSSLPISYIEKYQRSPNGSFRDIYDMNGWNLGWFAQDSWRATPSLTLNFGVRYDIDLSGSALAPYAPAGRPYGKNTYDMISPRFGFAVTPFKAHPNTVIRGGVSLYYDKDTYLIPGAWMSDTAFSVQNFNLNANLASGNPYCFGNSTCTTTVPNNYKQYVEFELAKALANYTLPVFPAPGQTDTVTVGTTTMVIPAATFTGPNGQQVPSPFASGNDIDPNLTIPGQIQFAIGGAHQFSDTLNVSADFVYNNGFKQILVTDINVNPYTLQAPLNSNYTTDLQWNNKGSFVDKTLRVMGSYRSHRGDTISLAYTLGFANDNTTTGFTAGTATGSSNPFNVNADYGPSSQDARHILNFSSSFRIPFGIIFSPIVQYNSALPYTATTTATVTGCPTYYTFCYPTGYTKNSLRGGNLRMVNSRLAKTVRLGGTRDVMFLIEGYNLTNTDNFGTNFTTSVSSTSFMKPSGTTATPKRQLQFGFRLDF
jgi:hypothetical protein